MTNDRISPYDAERDYAYTITEFGTDVSCNIRVKIESMIKPNWLYFDPRPEDHNKWLDRVKEDAKAELHRAKEHVKDVEAALALLARIDREDE